MLTSIMVKKRRKEVIGINVVIRGLPSQIAAWKAKGSGVSSNVSWWVRRTLCAAANGDFRVRYTEKQHAYGDGLKQFQIRATESEIALWTQAAAAQDLERNEWCRQVLDAASVRKNQAFLVL